MPYVKNNQYFQKTIKKDLLHQKRCVKIVFFTPQLHKIDYQIVNYIFIRGFCGVKFIDYDKKALIPQNPQKNHALKSYLFRLIILIINILTI